MAAIAGPEIERLITLLAKLPGLGPRSARRAALAMVKKRETLLLPLASALAEVGERVTVCSVCGNVDTADPCTVCIDGGRDPTMIIVVEDVADLWALERAAVMRTRYHVLGGTISALDGYGPEDIGIGRLVERAAEEGVREVVLAMNATVEGQTTAHYITERLEPLGITVSRLASGVPIGGELDYLDEGTLAAALNQRRPFG
ncbi:recombination mediator RecR [Acuticoccus sp. M5D2P5]|uniref:recombination mediator RecR n=1 Tax=Acuticoccus kalidii TaxID=2910977 RepID=UPI001F33E2F9|nr:recombination mediator RecR [Acuticoccus kalidii]MCF3935898.1 recombination mediator RecR [Acuticoccus kalidii]